DLARVFEALKHNASIIIAAEIENALAQPKLPARIDQPRHPRWLLTSKPKKAAAPPFETVAERDQRVVSAWLEQLHKAGDSLRASCFAALHRIATAIISRHGQLLGDEALLGELAVTLLCNDFGSEVIGEAILPFVQEAVAREGYRFLPRQEKPVVMN